MRPGRLAGGAAAALCALSIPPSATSASLRDLSPEQQKTARCMLSVVRSQNGVTSPRLRLATSSSSGASSKPAIHIFIDYDYHHRGAVTPHVASEDIEVTDEVVTKRGGFGLAGLTSEQAPDLNDNDDGLLEMAAGWDRKCGVAMAVITD